MINITESAQKEFERILREEGKGNVGVRLGVKGGGCSGYSYVLKFESEQKEGDIVTNEARVPIFIDAKSLELLKGMEVDYTSDLLNRGFKFQNPNASKSCGCGTSFAV